ncbi:lipase/esterase, partial [Aureobasidium melanogenum]
MPAYEVEHVCKLTDDQKDQLAEAITKIHSQQFSTPRLFVNVRITDVSDQRTYVAGKQYKSNRIFAYVRHGPSRTQSDYDAVSKALEDEWAKIVPGTELRLVMFYGAIVAGMEAGLYLPPAGQDAAWIKENWETFVKKAEGGDEHFAGLIKQTKEEVAKLGEMDPELAEWLKTNPIPKGNWNNIKEFRAMRDEMGKQKLAALGPAAPHVEESFQNITMRDGFENQIKIHKPTGKTGGPLLVLIFGGGFVVGDIQQLTPYSRGLARAFDAVVVNTAYRLAPENKFPTAPHDTEDTLLWLAKNAESLGADPSKGFILGGVSAGGNLTACIAQKTLEDKSLAHPLTGLWLCVPLVFPNKDLVPDKYKDVWFSHEQNADAPILDKTAIDAVGRHLEPDQKSPLYSPFNSKNPHKGLPPTYVQVDGLDPLRDDGLIYEQVLSENGVKTKLDIWPGLPHAHFSFLPFLSGSKKAIVDTFVGFAWLLKTEVSLEKIQEVMVAPASG